jgi:hypothetical protein
MFAAGVDRHFGYRQRNAKKKKIKINRVGDRQLKRRFHDKNVRVWN